MLTDELIVHYRYTPQQQSVSFNSGAKQRTIHMFEVQKDPMEPPRFRWANLPWTWCVVFLLTFSLRALIVSYWETMHYTRMKCSLFHVVIVMINKSDFANNVTV